MPVIAAVGNIEPDLVRRAPTQCRSASASSAATSLASAPEIAGPSLQRVGLRDVDVVACCMARTVRSRASSFVKRPSMIVQQALTHRAFRDAHFL